MKITGLYINSFGIWSQVHFDQLSSGVNVFYGPNEAGKTTLLQFIRMVLYGFGCGRAQRYLMNAGQGMLSGAQRIGGMIELATRDDEYQVRRYASQTQPRDDLPGELRVTARDGTRQGGHRLLTLLGGIDEAIFNNVYAVGLREMQYLGTLNDTQASRYLYNLSTGTDRVSLVDVMRQLQASRTNLMEDGETDCLLTRLLSERDRRRQDLQVASASIDRWAQSRADINQLDFEIARLESARATMQIRTRQLDLACRVQPIWQRRREVESELQSMGAAPAVPEDTQRELKSLAAEIADRQHKLHELTSPPAAVDVPNSLAVDDDTFVHHSIRLEALLDDRPTIAALDEDLHVLKRRREDVELKLQAEFQRLGLVDPESEQSPNLDDHVLATLRPPAQRIERLKQQIEESKKESARFQAMAQQINGELAEALGKDLGAFDRQAGDLPASEDFTRQLALRLRQRLSLQKSLVDLRQRAHFLAKRKKSLLASQLLPWEVIQAVGAMFIIGFVLLVFAFFGQMFEISLRSRCGLGVMGAVAVLVAGLLKLLLHGSTRRELHESVSELKDVQEQLEQVTRQCAELDNQIPGHKKGRTSVKSLRNRLLNVESLMPQDTKRRQLLHGSQAHEYRAEQLAHRLKDARDAWAESLRHFGLSAKLAPDQFDSLAANTQHIAKMYRLAEQLDQQIYEVQYEVGTHYQRISGLLSDLKLVSHGDRLTDHLSQLASARQAFEERKRALAKHREFERRRHDQEQELSRELRQLISRRMALITAQGAIDDDNLQQFFERRRHWEQLVRQRDGLNDEINILLPGKELQGAVFGHLLAETGDTLAERLQSLQAEAKRSDQRLKELLLRRGEVAEHCKQLVADRTLAEHWLRLGQVETQLSNAIQQAQTVNAMMHLLRQVYKKYEYDRQPETLQEASKYLERMTRGKYTRIWTPLDEDALYVDDPQRLSIPVDQLSRGTREQLFLALRLALVAGYSRRGVNLPLVLDDVLVNFDIDRTRSTAEVLIEFAHAGHQMLIFTCHEHVTELFADRGAEVRRLPIPSNSRETQATVPTSAQNKPTARSPQSAPRRASRARPRRRSHARREPELVPSFVQSVAALGYDEQPGTFGDEHGEHLDASPSGQEADNDIAQLRQYAL